MKRFTVTQRHHEVDALKAPTLCIAQLEKDGKASCYIGVLKRMDAVSTFDTRLSFVRLRRIACDLFHEIKTHLKDQRFEGLFGTKVKGRSFIALSPVLSSRLLERIWERTRRKSRRHSGICRASSAWKVRRGSRKTPLIFSKAVFGLNASDLVDAETGDYVDEFCESGSRLSEDNVIAHDARNVPGYDLTRPTRA